MEICTSREAHLKEDAPNKKHRGQAGGQKVGRHSSLRVGASGWTTGFRLQPECQSPEAPTLNPEARRQDRASLV